MQKAFALKQGRRLIAVILISAGLLGLSFIQGHSQVPGSLEVVFIDVGAGDAALLRDSSGFTVLIDGGQYRPGAAVVTYLRYHEITQIDVMVVSHAHDDHVAGLTRVLEMSDVTVKSVVYNGYPGTSTVWKDFLAAVAARGLKPTVALYPDTLHWGEMTAHVLNPLKGLPEPVDLNAVSLVLRVDYGDFNILFTGDIGATEEAEIVARGTPVAADILKVPYHGSPGSSSDVFLAAVKPADSIISSATDPHPDVLTRLESAGSRVWWTKRDGNITFMLQKAAYTPPPKADDLKYRLNLPLLTR